MKGQKSLPYLFSILMIACLHVSVFGQATDEKNKLATMTGLGSGVRWEVATAYSSATLTVATPDGRVFRREFKAGSAPEFMISDKAERLPDGQYIYELRIAQELSASAKAALAAARGKDDDAEEVRATRKRSMPAPLVQSGGFSIANGAVIVAGAIEEGSRPSVSKVAAPPRVSENNSGQPVVKTLKHHPLLIASPDQVIPDDLIVQGSACVGLDCVNGEVFGFDTIRVKENNTRIQFDDTSAAGFPLNNWQIRANSSAAGGASFLGFVDQGAAGNSETGTIVFEVDAGAPANSLKVGSNGKVGLRTATPVLDVHANTSDTPAIRLEQNNTGGFTAQTWDIAGNEANFFVRDVTSGSRLPFRIRPGAPTSSIDISASGDVGIGFASPAGKLQVLSNSPDRNTNTQLILSDSVNNLKQLRMGWNNTTNYSYIQSTVFGTSGNILSLNEAGGNVGVGTATPTETLSVNGTASKPGGGSWAVFSDERLKNIKGRFNTGLNAVMQLQPLRYEYKQNNALGLNSAGDHIGFGAQAVQKIIPEAVTTTESGYLQVNNDPILWTMLNAIKEQQKQIEQLKGEVRQLRAATRRRK